ncbi:hypothetical protein IQ265_00040 [Nodosilinea sp. LEGE 06152]|uniref:hypothetical protein n=1 Tax=Nodosilinea sp. LEGE 06152 TaxID=2777966 RepID=UPI00187FA14E|nr:hypothetical protein [Nodosilinea sp. LEGE 06152]MBE9155238.1 hypothetical protein [Nodosilinea sp. LEGE 06152]
MAHFQDIDPSYIIPIPAKLQSSRSIEILLKEKGSPEMCYVISENGKIDGALMRINEALDSVLGRGMATFLSCLPGELIYYEGDEIGRRFLCCKHSLQKHR